MEVVKLKNEKGGYDKKNVLLKIQMYQFVLMAAEKISPEDGPEVRDKLIGEYERAKQLELPRVKSGFLGGSGFSVEDTDNYIAMLEAEIDRKLF